VDTAARHALDDFLIGDVDLDDVVDRHAGGLHRFGLRNGAREAVEQIAVLAVRLLKARLHHADDDVVGDEAASIHDGLGLHAKLGAGLDLRTQHVAGGDLRNAVFFLDVIGLGAFAGARAAQQNQTHCVSPSIMDVSKPH